MQLIGKSLKVPEKASTLIAHPRAPGYKAKYCSCVFMRSQHRHIHVENTAIVHPCARSISTSMYKKKRRTGSAAF